MCDPALLSLLEAVKGPGSGGTSRGMISSCGGISSFDDFLLKELVNRRLTKKVRFVVGGVARTS